MEAIQNARYCVACQSPCGLGTPVRADPPEPWLRKIGLFGMTDKLTHYLADCGVLCRRANGTLPLC